MQRVHGLEIKKRCILKMCFDRSQNSEAETKERLCIVLGGKEKRNVIPSPSFVFLSFMLFIFLLFARWLKLAYNKSFNINSLFPRVK